MESKGHKNLQELTRNLAENAEKLAKGKLELEAIESFYKDAQSVYERAVILRAKAYSGKDIEPAEKLEKSASSKSEQKEEPAKTSQPENHEEDMPMFDFTKMKEAPINEKEEVKEKQETPVSAEEKKSQEENPEKQVEDVAEPKKPEPPQEEKPKAVDEKSTKENNSRKLSGEKQVDKDPGKKEEEKEKPSVGEKISPKQEVVNSINDHFRTAEDSSLLADMKKKPINNLRAAIGINDKFSYIKDLFDGENAIYELAIDKLNNLKNSDEAKVQLSEMAIENDWDLESKTVMQFVELIERRYAQK